MPERLWITWEVQRRNRSMSKVLGAELYELVLVAPFWWRYPVLVIKTINLIWRTRPQIIFSQNPSLVLAAVSVLMGKLLRTSVVIDAHNAGLFPAENRSPWLNKLARVINNRADMVIVTNSALKDYVENGCGRAYVFPDPIPDINASAGLLSAVLISFLSVVGLKMSPIKRCCWQPVSLRRRYISL